MSDAGDLAARDAPLYCTFWVAGHWFGVDATLVSEVHGLPDVTPIAGAPRAVAGYVNLRGQLYVALSAAEILTFDAADTSATARLIVFRSSAGESFALVVDALGGMVDATADRIDSYPQTPATAGARSLAIGRARLEPCSLTLIDAPRLLAAAFGEL